MTNDRSAPRPGPEGEEPRDFVRYLFWKLAPDLRREPSSERSRRIDDAVRCLESPPAGLTLRTYSLVGTKAGPQGFLWMIAPKLESFQELEARLWAGELGPYLDLTHSYLGLARRSEYLGGHAHAGQEGGKVRPTERPYLFVYPFVKKRSWYALPFEERRRIMAEHIQIGHRYPGVDIHTAYSFGIDDAEFILSFEADAPADFLDLVQALRPSEASRYTELETPIFTGIRVPPRRMWELAAGTP